MSLHTLQEHQMILTNATVSKVSDIENEWWSMRKLVFYVIQRSKEMYGQNNTMKKILADREIRTALRPLHNI